MPWLTFCLCGVNIRILRFIAPDLLLCLQREIETEVSECKIPKTELPSLQSSRIISFEAGPLWNLDTRKFAVAAKSEL